MKPGLKHVGLVLGIAILLLWIGDRFLSAKGKPSPELQTDPPKVQKSGADGARLGPLRAPNAAATNVREPSAPSLLIQIQTEMRHCPDPAAEKLLDLFQEAGIPEAEQVRHFWHSYNQLVRIDYHDELIAEDRLATRTTLQEVATNTLYSSEARRQSRLATEELRASFEARLRKQQAEMLDEIVGNLGSARFPQEELRRRLMEVHPHLPLEGSVTNLLTPPPPPGKN